MVHIRGPYQRSTLEVHTSGPHLGIAVHQRCRSVPVDAPRDGAQELGRLPYHFSTRVPITRMGCQRQLCIRESQHGAVPSDEGGTVEGQKDGRSYGKTSPRNWRKDG